MRWSLSNILARRLMSRIAYRVQVGADNPLDHEFASSWRSNDYGCFTPEAFSRWRHRKVIGPINKGGLQP